MSGGAPKDLTAADLDPKRLIEGSPGFATTLGLTIEESSRERAVGRLDAGAHLFNHVGGPHAAAIYGLGELTSFALLLEVFGDLVRAGAVPLVKEGTIRYSAIATGPLLATATLTDDETAARASLEERRRATFAVEVLFARESDEVQTAAATYRMALLRV